MTHVKRNLILIGGGGHAKVIADCARTSGWSLTGFLDDAANTPLSQADLLPHLGLLKSLNALAEQTSMINAIGDNNVRQRTTVQLLQQLNAEASDVLATVIHATAVVSEQATIAAGVFIGPGAIVNARANIGAGAIINSGAIVEHDCAIADYAHIAPGAVLGGEVAVGRQSLVGLGSSVLPGVCIGAHAIVGAGSVVCRNVEPKTTVRGNPAR